MVSPPIIGLSMVMEEGRGSGILPDMMRKDYKEDFLE
jgi:hypothetical protein